MNKLPDWIYALKGAIYLTLIGYTESSGYSIPCKERDRMEKEIVDKFILKINDPDFHPSAELASLKAENEALKKQIAEKDEWIHSHV